MVHGRAVVPKEKSEEEMEMSGREAVVVARTIKDESEDEVMSQGVAVETEQGETEVVTAVVALSADELEVETVAGEAAAAAAVTGEDQGVRTAGTKAVVEAVTGDRIGEGMRDREVVVEVEVVT